MEVPEPEELTAAGETPAVDQAVREADAVPEERAAVPTAAPETSGDQADAGPPLDVEDPPEPRRYEEVTAFPTDPAYRLHLSVRTARAWTRVRSGTEGAAIATLHRSSGNGWYGRLAVEGLPADVTSLGSVPQAAADRAAILFAALTDAPYGQAPAAADDGPLSRADVVRRRTAGHGRAAPPGARHRGRARGGGVPHRRPAGPEPTHSAWCHA